MPLENKVSCSTKMNLLCLSDEILLIILNKLSNTDVLYSLIEVNKRLDRLVRHCSLSKSIDFVLK